MDDALLKSLGDEAVGVISAAYYSADRRHPEQQALRGGDAEGLRRAARRLLGRHVRRRPVRRGRHRRSSAARPTTARRSPRPCTRSSLADTPRGPVKFDQYGNVVGDVFIRRCERKGGQLVNTVIKTYPNVSQFWTYNEKEFLANPVYTRDYPPAKNLEN